MRGKRTELLILLVPAAAYLLIFRVVPVLYTVRLSFTSYNLVLQGKPAFVGLDNYRALLQDSLFLKSIKLSLIYMSVATGLELVLGFGLAHVFDRQLRAKGALISIILLPMIIAPIVVGTIWHVLYHDLIGPLNYFLSCVRLPQPEWVRSAPTALLSIIIADVWEWTPFIFLFVLSALQNIPDEIVEAAKIDGASAFWIVTRINVPLIADVILIAVVLRSMDAFRTLDLAYILTGGGPGTATELLSLRILNTAFRSFQLGYAASIVIFMLAFCFAMYYFYLRRIGLDL